MLTQCDTYFQEKLQKIETLDNLFLRMSRSMEMFYKMGQFDLIKILNENYNQVEFQAFRVAITIVHQWSTQYPKKIFEQRLDEKRPIFGERVPNQNFGITNAD